LLDHVLEVIRLRLTLTHVQGTRGLLLDAAELSYRQDGAVTGIVRGMAPTGPRRDLEDVEAECVVRSNVGLRPRPRGLFAVVLQLDGTMVFDAIQAAVVSWVDQR
jgi:hypothetical protein